MNIGNITDAMLAATADAEYTEMLCERDTGEYRDTLEMGTWEGQTESATLAIDTVSMVGSGSCRRVWTIDGEVAYKVNTYENNDFSNKEEWKRWVKFHHIMPAGTRLPLMARYEVDGRVILAVEIIKFPRQWNGGHVPELPFHFLDAGSYNYRTAPDGTFIPIDFAF